MTGLSEDTIERACKREHKRAFAEYAAEKRGYGAASLRRRQWAKAIEEGDTTMLIFLGKQYLNQTDRRREEQAGESTMKIIVEYVDDPAMPASTDTTTTEAPNA